MFLRKAVPFIFAVLIHALVITAPIRLYLAGAGRGGALDFVFERDGAPPEVAQPVRSARKPAVAPAPAARPVPPKANPTPRQPVPEEPAYGAPPETVPPESVVPEQPPPTEEPPAQAGTSAAQEPVSPEPAAPVAEAPQTPDPQPVRTVPLAPEGSLPSGVSARIGWIGVARSLMRRQPVPFPRILSTAGQEVDCEARISVSSQGLVTKVEIVRSSGYTEIDASVETALRGYLFSRDYRAGTKNAVGLVTFRFRLEKLD